MAPLRFRTVGFDLDGTLFDTSGDLAAALNHALGTIGRDPVPLGEVRNLIGGGARAMLARGLALTGGAEGIDEDALLNALLAHYADHIAVHTRPYPGVLAAIDALAAAGIAPALVTNKAQPLAEALLAALGLAPRFALVIGRDGPHGLPPKPAPDTLLAMQATLGGPAAYVGDSSFDVRAARAAGIPCVAVRFGFADRPVDSLGADAVIDHYDDLLTVLSQL